MGPCGNGGIYIATPDTGRFRTGYPFCNDSRGRRATFRLARQGRQGSRLFSTVKKGLGVLPIIGAIAFYFTTPQHVEGIKWIPYDKSLLTQAAIENRPVIFDFYADWCPPCKELDKNVFTAPEVIRLSKHFQNIRLDLTKRHPEQDLLLKRYQVRGVPTVIFFNRKGAEERELRIESYVDKNEMLKRMRQMIRLSSK